MKAIVNICAKYILGGLGLLFLGYALAVGGGVLLMGWMVSPVLFEVLPIDDGIIAVCMFIVLGAYICLSIYVCIWYWRKVFRGIEDVYLSKEYENR